MARKAENNSKPCIIKPIGGGVTAARGFRASAVKAGIKASGKMDAALILSDTDCAAAGAFTLNRVRASSVDWCAKTLPSGTVRAVFCNSGNANACTGIRGKRDTRKIAQMVAQHIGTNEKSILIASTGIIGQFLPMDKLLPVIPKLTESAMQNKGTTFARAIMTTDLKKKECAYEVQDNAGSIRIGGCAKGSGMIHPNMATMLAFITTDALIDHNLLDRMVARVIDRTFNNLTVDGDTSTNDMVLVLANGASGCHIDKQIADCFEDTLFNVCNNLCRKIAEDGEGATKRIEVVVTGGKTYRDAKLAAKAVANSNLVKTALFGNDPNWGRILCAVGYSGANFSKDKLIVSLCGVPVCSNLQPKVFDAKKLSNMLKKKVVSIDIDLGQGPHSAIANTCDLSYDYIKINAEYHT